MSQNARLRSAAGPFDSEEDAAVGKTDCTTMPKLVPFVWPTDARRVSFPRSAEVRQAAQSNRLQ